MKWCFGFILSILVVAAAGARAQGLDDQYLSIFNLIQEADTLSKSQPSAARAKYLEAQTLLQRFQSGNPNWNPQLVGFRLSYLANKLSVAGAEAAPAAPAVSNKPPEAQPAAATAAPVASAQGELQNQVTALTGQVRQLEAERGLLEAKLKEALAALPAAADPRELTRAEEKVKELQKENELLKANVQAEKTRTGAEDPVSREQTQVALAAAQNQIKEQKEAILTLSAEKQALQTKLKSNLDAAALQAENDVLKKQILSQGTSAPASKPEDNSRVRQLERERDDLQKKLDKANQATAGKKGKTAAKREQDLEMQLSSARARLEVLEARQVPYTAEELALLKVPPPTLAEQQPPKPAKKSELPPGAGKWMSEAQTYYASRQYDKAEAAYAEVVKLDPRNVLALANLAAVQSESGKLDAAEASVKTALAENPDDSYSLYILGLTKFRQKSYDDSLDAFSRAAKLDPQNAEIQNYLGLALSEKGMRGPAETALRKAIQLQPNFALAHYNLAVAYATQKPPAVELARWHYQKALALGHPHNADLESRLQGK